jgi:hypothetical protein
MRNALSTELSPADEGSTLFDMEELYGDNVLCQGIEQGTT